MSKERKHETAFSRRQSDNRGQLFCAIYILPTAQGHDFGPAGRRPHISRSVELPTGYGIPTVRDSKDLRVVAMLIGRKLVAIDLVHSALEYRSSWVSARLFAELCCRSSYRNWSRVTSICSAPIWISCVVVFLLREVLLDVVSGCLTDTQEHVHRPKCGESKIRGANRSRGATVVFPNQRKKSSQDR